MTPEFLTETHEQDGHRADHHALAQLSRNFSQRGIQELFAGMTRNSVIFNKLVSGNKNKSFSLTAEEANDFVDAWTQFQINSDLWEAKEVKRKEQEALAEVQRKALVWLKIDQLAHSIPGVKIIAREEERWDYSIDDYGKVPAWDVKLPALGAERTYNYTPKEVLQAVNELVERYNRHLEACEEGEKKNWYGETEKAVQNVKDFLSAHRAFIAQQQKEQSSPEVVAAASYHDGDC